MSSDQASHYLRRVLAARLLARMTDDPSGRAGFLLVFSTFPEAAKARETACVLVGERLAACANVLPGVTSIYVWQGKQTESEEVLVLFKTRRETYPALESRLKSLHPYKVPEIVAVEIAAGLSAYLDWVAAAVAASSPR